jgi:hypothetical protein
MTEQQISRRALLAGAAALGAVPAQAQSGAADPADAIGLAQRIREGAGAGTDAARMAEEIMEQADVTAARLGDFMEYARMRSQRMAPVDGRAMAVRVSNGSSAAVSSMCRFRRPARRCASLAATG